MMVTVEYDGISKLIVLVANDEDVLLTYEDANELYMELAIKLEEAENDD